MRDLLEVLKKIDTDVEEMEAAARRVCKRRGEDPDERVYCNDGTGHAVARYRPRWMNVYDELQEFATSILALVEE